MITWIVLIFSLFICTAVALFFTWNIYAIISGAPYVPSSRSRIRTMIELAKLSNADILMDVGSGDGRVLRSVAHLVKEAQGVEINPALVYWTRVISSIRKYKNIVVLQKNFWLMDLCDVDVLFVYCIDSKMDRLERKLQKEMKPGSRILSNGFVLPTVKPHQQKDGVSLYIL